MKNVDHQRVGIGLLALFFIFIVIILLYINPIIEEKHPMYNRTELSPQYGFYISNITCPNCDSINIEPYASHIADDNHNKRIITFFYCRNCSTIFSIRPDSDIHDRKI